jgi:hypothetical protein
MRAFRFIGSSTGSDPSVGSIIRYAPEERDTKVPAAGRYLDIPFEFSHDPGNGFSMDAGDYLE